MDARQRFAAEVGRLRLDAGLSLAKLGAAAHIERSYVHNITAGRRWPSRAVAQGLDIALGADGALFALWSSGDTEPPTRSRGANRQQTGYRSAGAESHHDESRPWRADATHGLDLRSRAFERQALDRPVLDWVIGNSATPVPANRSGRSVADQDVQIAAEMLALFRKLDHLQGAGHVRERAVSYAATEVDDLLSRPPARRSTEIELMAVAAGTCEMIGYQAVDIGANSLALRYYTASIRFSEAAGDRAFGAHLLAANIAHLALHAGHPDDALRVVLAAQREIGAATPPAVRSASFAVEARVHAKMGNEKPCTAALVVAESSLSRSDPEDEPTWIRYFTPAYLKDEIAHCMHDLGLHGQTQRIVRAAVADLDPSRVRRLAIDNALLATSLAESGQVEEACAVGREAVAHACRTHSVRAMLRINDMRRALSRYVGAQGVIDLECIIRDTLPGVGDRWPSQPL
jgi:transcriptional regulator with XRE-family HTH domain